MFLFWIKGLWTCTNVVFIINTLRSIFNLIFLIDLFNGIKSYIVVSFLIAWGAFSSGKVYYSNFFNVVYQ